MNDNERQFEEFVRGINFDDRPDPGHRDGLEEKLLRVLSNRPRRKWPLQTWRILMKNRLTRLAAAVVLLVAVGGLLSILDKSVAPAYAVGQTVDAIRQVKTVHLAGEFYKQGKFECWMKFDGNPDRPTHVWLGREGQSICKICSPQGVFGLNRRTSWVHLAARDERGKDWILKFGSFFEEAVKKAGTDESVEIGTEARTDGKEFIVISIKTPNREQKFLVDSVTKLPISFSTTRDDAPMEMMKKTLAIRNLEWIRYNEQPPEGIFDMPPDAKLVESEVDCMVDPDSGLVVDGMSRQEACLAITKQACQAMIDLDVVRLESLALFFKLWPPEAWEMVRDAKAAGKWIQGYEITGTPYQEGDVWYVPCLLKLADNKTEINTPMIKFYQMEGKTYCFAIGSKEKGVVD